VVALGGSPPVSELVDVAAGICARDGGNHLVSRPMTSETHYTVVVVRMIRTEKGDGEGRAATCWGSNSLLACCAGVWFAQKGEGA
jgi:hypothetical protein